MKFLCPSVGLALTIIATPLAAEEVRAAPAAAPAAEQPATSEAKPQPDEKLICTREAAIGSRMATRVCRTKAQIEAERRDRKTIDQQRGAGAN